MLQKTVTRGKTKICGKILKQIIAEESTLKATIPENESHIYRKYVIIGTLNFKKCRPSGGTFYFFFLVRNPSGNSFDHGKSRFRSSGFGKGPILRSSSNT